MTDDRATDTALLARLARDDADALAELVHTYRDGLYNYVARLLGSDADADDILQDIFAALWVRRETFEVETSLRAYLYTAARNRAFDRLDRARRAAHVEIHDPTADAPSNGDAATSVETDDLVLAIRGAVDRLPPRCREVFVLAREEGLSYPEIAVTMGVSVGTVKTQMSRAMQVILDAAAPFLVVTLALRGW